MTEALPISTQLFSRQQIASLTGIDDSTLNYWSRENLLVPTEGGSGRGSHRRFDFVQVNVAAVLGEVRRFGLNLAALRSLSGLLQSAVNFGSRCDIHPGSYSSAARLATALHKFRQGDEVTVSAHSGEKRPENLSGGAYGDWLLERRCAVNEREIITDLIGWKDDFDEISSIVSTSDLIGPGMEVEAGLYTDLVVDIIAPGYSGTYSWLLAIGPDGTWRVEMGSDAQFFDSLNSGTPEDFGSGIFIPLSGVFRKLWGRETQLEHSAEQ